MVVCGLEVEVEVEVEDRGEYGYAEAGACVRARHILSFLDREQSNLFRELSGILKLCSRI